MQQTYAAPVTVISDELVGCLRAEATTRLGAAGWMQGGHVEGLPSQVLCLGGRIGQWGQKRSQPDIFRH